MHFQETSKKQKRRPLAKDSEQTQANQIPKPKRRERPAARAARLRFRKSQIDSHDVSDSRQNPGSSKNYSRGTIRNMCEAQIDTKKSVAARGKIFWLASDYLACF